MKILKILIIVFLLASCQQKEQGFATNPVDYNKYLNTGKPKTTSKHFELWNDKITKDSTQLLSFSHVAAEYERYFKSTGNINFLKKAEKALIKAVEIANIGKESYLRALARNYISQHRFKEALQITVLANENGCGKTATQALQFDVHMELGNYDIAKKYLDSIKNIADFEYLIRSAKWNDFKGDLDTTIRFMEMALKKAESSKNKTLMLWSYTNLADYYGHAVQIQDSYRSYLKALKLDPQNAYAKKGIAWIVFSHEKNGEEALRILNAITENNQSPDYYLLKAEMAEFMNDEVAYQSNMDAFYTQTQNKAYGEMYNSYMIDYYLGQNKELAKAMKLAQRELKNRATPEAYAQLAKTYLKMGEKHKALKIIKDHIIDKTYEPTILLIAAEIFKANGENDRVASLKNELAEASFELGPVVSQQIKML